MSKPVVIFGAGASYDAVDITLNTASQIEKEHLKKWLLPLTNDIFHPKYANLGFEQSGFLDHFILDARKAIHRGTDLESFLRRFQDTRVENFRMNNPEKHFHNKCQIIAVRYYLWNLISSLHTAFITESEKKMIRSSNYCLLLNALTDNCPEGAVFITFNYDLFIENAMQAVLNYTYPNIYVYYRNREFPLFKLHGSVNWGHTGASIPLSVKTLPEHIRYIAGNQSVEAEYYKNVPWVKNSPQNYSTNFFPAIQIPLPQQKGFLIKEHESLVIDALRETDRLILIGWSARDEYMVKLIKEKVDMERTSVMVVSGSERKNVSDADAVLRTITSDGNMWKYSMVKNNGFSGVTTQEWDEFLQGEQ